MRRILFGFVAVCLTATPLCAQTVFFDGTIGKAPVFGSLSRDGDSLIGWYLYPKFAKQIELSGKIAANGTFHLEEMNFQTVKTTGTFDGHKTGTTWNGTWKSVKGGPAVAFSFAENHEALSKLSGDFRCAETHVDRKYGYRYSRSARVAFSNGAVTHLDLNQGSKGQDGDEQTCSIALSDLERVRGDDVLLRAKGDQPGENTGHCSIRIVGNADFLYVSLGDTAEKNNDCKSASDVMFCSPRANWGDFLIARKSKVCGPAE